MRRGLVTAGLKSATLALRARVPSLRTGWSGISIPGMLRDAPDTSRTQRGFRAGIRLSCGFGPKGHVAQTAVLRLRRGSWGIKAQLLVPC